MNNQEKPWPLFHVCHQWKHRSHLWESITSTQSYIVVFCSISVYITRSLWMVHDHFYLACSRLALEADCIRIPRAFVPGVHDRCMIWLGFRHSFPAAYPLVRSMSWINPPFRFQIQQPSDWRSDCRRKGWKSNRLAGGPCHDLERIARCAGPVNPQIPRWTMW